MPACVVKSCRNYREKIPKTQGITYHVFPRNKIRRDEWTSIIRNSRGESDWKPSSHSIICSAHFDDDDFVTTAKGLRRLLLTCAIPKWRLTKSTETESPSSPIPQMSPNAGEMENDQQPTSSSTISNLPQVSEVKEELKTGYCRLCASSYSDDTLVDVQSDNVMKELIVKMLARLKTNIDFSFEHLPTTICSNCIKSLYTSYDFVVGIDMSQITLNNISIQNQNYQMPVNNQDTNVDPLTSSLQKNNASEACDIEQPALQQVSSETTSSQQLSPKIAAPRANLAELSTNHPLFRDNRRLRYTLHKKELMIDMQKRNIKRLNQKVRRFTRRNESLKNILKTLKERNISPDLEETPLRTVEVYVESPS